MSAAMPVPSSPPIALTADFPRSSRSIISTIDTPTATAAAVLTPASAYTSTNRTGPSPVSTIARLSRRSSSGSGGSFEFTPVSPCPGESPSGRLLPATRALWASRRRSHRFGGREHQVVEDARRQARLEQGAIDALERDVPAVRVLDPRPRDVPRVGAPLQRAVEPPEPVREQLLALHADAGEPGAGGVGLQVRRDERVDVDHGLQRVVSRLGVVLQRRARFERSAPQRGGLERGGLRDVGEPVSGVARL